MARRHDLFCMSNLKTCGLLGWYIWWMWQCQVSGHIERVWCGLIVMRLCPGQSNMSCFLPDYSRLLCQCCNGPVGSVFFFYCFRLTDRFPLRKPFANPLPNLATMLFMSRPPRLWAIDRDGLSGSTSGAQESSDRCTVGFLHLSKCQPHVCCHLPFPEKVPSLYDDEARLQGRNTKQCVTVKVSLFFVSDVSLCAPLLCSVV